MTELVTGLIESREIYVVKAAVTCTNQPNVRTNIF